MVDCVVNVLGDAAQEVQMPLLSVSTQISVMISFRQLDRRLFL